MRRVCFFILFGILSTTFNYGIQLEKIDCWKHDQTYWGPISGSFLDFSGDLVLKFNKGPVVFNKNESVPFALFGQGPDEITQLFTICEYREDLALFEDINKVKVFKKTGSTYTWKQTIWLKRDPLPLFLKAALFYKGHLFLAGWNVQGIPTSPDTMNVANLQIFEENSKSPGKNIILETGVKADRQYEIDRFLIPYGDHVLYLKQSEMKIIFVSLKTLDVEKSIDLSIPRFYKPMPKDFYMRKDYKGNHKDYLIDLENWSTSYSAITKAVLYKNDYLILQIRTCSEQQGKFALLLYNLKNSCSLDGVYFINDLLLAERDGKLYCYKNGNPDLDEDAETTEINIYGINE